MSFLILRTASIPICVIALFFIWILEGRIVRAEHISRSGPPTPSTCFWTEREFPDIEPISPENAAGIILWNHGQDAKAVPSWRTGAPPVIRRFAERGWEVRLVQRNERCQGNWNTKGAQYVENLIKEVIRAREEGYAKIVLAGQSYGAGTALGAGSNSEVDGVIAFALSHGRGACRDQRTFKSSMILMHSKYIKEGIRELQTPRILISMGTNDHCIDHSFTPLINRELLLKPVSYLFFDEKMKFEGHAAALSKAFDKTYGECIFGFFNKEHMPPGRTSCEESK